MPRQYFLRRTGQAPLSFHGTKIAGASSFVADPLPSERKMLSRWHELAVYETTAGQFVLSIAYRTEWRGENAHDDAMTFQSLSEVMACLAMVDPLEHFIGVPDGVEHQERKNRSLRTNLACRWATCVSDLLTGLPELAQKVE